MSDYLKDIYEFSNQSISIAATSDIKEKMPSNRKIFYDSGTSSKDRNLKFLTDVFDTLELSLITLVHLCPS